MDMCVCWREYVSCWWLGLTSLWVLIDRKQEHGNTWRIVPRWHTTVLMSTRWAVAGRLVGYSTPHGVCSSTRRSHGLLTPPSIDATFGLAAWSLLACCAPSQGSEAKGLQFQVLISRSVLYNHFSVYLEHGTTNRAHAGITDQALPKKEDRNCSPNWSSRQARWTASLFHSKL